jgi:hypothetical protein
VQAAVATKLGGTHTNKEKKRGDVGPVTMSYGMATLEEHSVIA